MRQLCMAFVGVLLLSACGSAHAQSPIAGQPYQVPQGYEIYGAGTLVTYGGFNYVIQGDGTMLPSAPTFYQPPQFQVYYQQPQYLHYHPHQYWRSGGYGHRRYWR